jgi:hypothetical protein
VQPSFFACIVKVFEPYSSGHVSPPLNEPVYYGLYSINL